MHYNQIGDISELGKALDLVVEAGGGVVVGGVPDSMTFLAHTTIIQNGQFSAVSSASSDRVGDGRPQQSPGWAAGAGLPSSASSIFTVSDAI